MKPHRLRLTAFGAFGGTVEVDFDRLAESGLFLLHGPTGAGKTTLLDGLGFALFGRVPGARNGAKRLRSDHAAEPVRTEVQLEVTFGRRRMRITRSPQQERAKSRGTGTTTEQAKVLLEELLDGGWATLSSRVGEADAEIHDLVGMSADQFFQVVLLPQGDFAQFLRADSAKRAEVLQKLFATERFADVEQWLAGRRRVTAEAVAAKRDEADRVLARVAEAAGIESVEGDPAPLLAAAQQAESLAQQEVSAQTAVRDIARTALDEATSFADRQRRRRDALAREAALDEQRPHILTLQQELDTALRAAEVAGVLRELDNRRTARDHALESLAVSRAALGADDRDLDAEELRATAVACRERAARLDALRPLEEDRARELAAIGAAREEQALAEAEVARLQVLLGALPGRRESAAARHALATEARQQVPLLTAERDSLAAMRPDLVALDALATRIDQLAGRHLAARETAVALLEKANDLRTASINTMIAKLAFALVPGTPCAVCGSLEHPDPSELRDEGVSAEDEEAARLAADDAAREVTELDAVLAAERATRSALRERVGDLTLSSLDERLASLDLELSVLASHVLDGDRADVVLAELDEQGHAATTGVVAATSNLEAAARREREARQRADVLLARLATELLSVQDAPGSLPDMRSLDEVLRDLEARVDVVDAAVAAGEVLERAQVELDRAFATAAAAATAKGFVDVDAARAAQRDEQWRREAAEQLRQVADVAAATAAELADPALDVDLDVPAPVAERAEELTAADAELTTRTALLAQETTRRAALERLLPTLAQVHAELAPLEHVAGRARRMADLCAGQGQNALKMTLTSFVLAARLEQVAAAATVRLLRMTQGRYELVHTDGAARGGARSGLGLLARDAWSGQDRDTATLSGGETFLASLALALGLADVVTAEAGGSRIEALFVDEGFGTLDEDTLDEVMDVLDGLREGGRLVGLVSHVAELRQRITAKVEVTKGRTGSALVVHGC